MVASSMKSWPSPPSLVELSQYPRGSLPHAALKLASDGSLQFPLPWMNTTVPDVPPQTMSRWVLLASAVEVMRREETTREASRIDERIHFSRLKLVKRI